MDVRQPARPSKQRARDRVQARRNRQMAVPAFMRSPGDTDDAPVQPRPATVRQPNPPRRRRRDTPRLNGDASWRERLRVLAGDIGWYALHRPYVLQGLGVFIIVVMVTFLLSHIISGRLYPNIWSLGAPLGDLTREEASAALQTAWVNEVRIDLVDQERRWTVQPAEIGLRLDVDATLDAAYAVGLRGIPFGANVVPVVELDLFEAQSYLLDLTSEANYAPQNAGFAWEGTRLVGVPGQAGRVLDVGMSLENLKIDPAAVVDRGEFVLEMVELAPDIADPTPHLETAGLLMQQPFEMVGYDPFRNEYMSWSTNAETLATWLEVNQNGLGLREDNYAPFLAAQNNSLDDVRYLESTETMQKIETALREGRNRVDLRIRYHATQYTVQPGDTGFKIARRVGLPFYLITTANPGLEWEQLAIGDVINIPTRDLTVPLDPVPGKRIVVDLDAQSLVAYEDGEEVFAWPISSGVAEFPTYPGVFQILTHDEVAFGSTFELCGSSGCGQWEMYWFMGIYEVVPGLMNGFHGAVLLPNGAYLGGGNVGRPYTYGCVMSEDSNAERLFHWADEGTIVEIISDEFESPSQGGDQVARGLPLAG